jgi:hypothetical protein
MKNIEIWQSEVDNGNTTVKISNTHILWCDAIASKKYPGLINIHLKRVINVFTNMNTIMSNIITGTIIWPKKNEREKNDLNKKMEDDLNKNGKRTNQPKPT